MEPENNKNLSEAPASIDANDLCHVQTVDDDSKNDIENVQETTSSLDGNELGYVENLLDDLISYVENFHEASLSLNANGLADVETVDYSKSNIENFPVDPETPDSDFPGVEEIPPEGIPAKKNIENYSDVSRELDFNMLFLPLETKKKVCEEHNIKLEESSDSDIEFIMEVPPKKKNMGNFSSEESGCPQTFQPQDTGDKEFTYATAFSKEHSEKFKRSYSSMVSSNNEMEILTPGICESASSDVLYFDPAKNFHSKEEEELFDVMERLIESVESENKTHFLWNESLDFRATEAELSGDDDEDMCVDTDMDNSGLPDEELREEIADLHTKHLQDEE